MKKILLGLVAAFAFASLAAPVARAEEAAGDKPAEGKKEKKGKKAKKGGDEKPAEGGDAKK